MRTILAISLMLVLAGCVSTGPAAEAQEPPVSPPAEEPAVEEPAEPVPEPEELPPAEPEEEPPPEQPVEEPEGEPVPSTSENASELLDDTLDELTTDFYRDHSGTFTENRFRWMVTPSPGEGYLVTSPASEIRFDGETIHSIQACGYVIFKDKQGEEDVYAAAVFSDQHTMLDTLFSPFDVEILRGRDLSWCQTTKKDVYQSSAGGYLSVYQFECESASDEE